MDLQEIAYEFEGILPELTDLFFKNTLEVYEDLSMSINSHNGVPMLNSFFMKGDYYFLMFASMHKEEYRRNAVLRGVRSADLFSFALGVRHAGFHSGADDGQFQFGKYRAHLDEGLAHGVYIACPAVDGDASEDFQSHMLLLNHIHNFAELLGASAQT